jgi:protein phosphatase
MSSYLSVEPDPFPRPPWAIRAASRTDRGLERTNNEDRAAFLELPGCFLGLVCDGMGGEAGGEIASRLAVETILPFLHDHCLESVGEGHIARVLAHSLEAASERIKAEARAEPAYARMGTTATLGAVLSGSRSFVCAQVGDSRAYLHRAGALTQLTHDQTLAELLRRSGDVPEGRVEDLVGAHVILQAVGSTPRLEVALTHTPLEAGDRILLCSDGLSGVVPHEVIATTLTSIPLPDGVCEALVAHALERGAPDNVTCVVLALGER